MIQQLEVCLERAPTLLENLFWGWMLGFAPASDYLDELVITDLRGHGNVPDDFLGEP
ncbi:MAG: hypothetical protein V4593_08220 [Pseudomonadota bacterium]